MALDPKAEVKDDNTVSSTSTKKNKKKNQASTETTPLASAPVNGTAALVPTAHATPLQSQREELLAERAENKAAVAAVAILAGKPEQQTTLTAAERILAKRSKALGKKLQRITQYEAQDPKTLNEDQKAVIASKDSVMAAMKELNEVGKAWRQVEQDTAAEQQAETQKAVEHEKKSREATGDATLTLLQHILRLFTLLHLPQIQAPTFAPTLPSIFLDSITSQEAAAVGKLYQMIISLPLYAGAETAQTGEDSVKGLLTLIETGDETVEVLPGVAYARIKELVSQLIAPVSFEVADEPTPATANDVTGQVDNPVSSEVATAAEVIDPTLRNLEAPPVVPHVNPEAVKIDAPNTPHVNGNGGATTKPSAAVGGISFLQSSEVSRSASAEPSVLDDSDVAEKTLAASASAVGPESKSEGVAIDAALPVPHGEQGLTPGISSAPPKFDWSADVEGEEDDLGDPLQAFADQRTTGEVSPIGKVPATEATIASPSVGVASEQRSTAPPVSAPTSIVASSVNESSKQSPPTGNGPANHHHHHHKKASPKTNGGTASEHTSTAHPNIQAQVPLPVKKAPIVDEDGFVLQTSKKMLHQQQLQQQQQQHRGRGRGRGGPRGGASGERGGRGGGSGTGTSGRGRGDFRGGVRGGRGGASGAPVSTA